MARETYGKMREDGTLEIAPDLGLSRGEYLERGWKPVLSPPTPACGTEGFRFEKAGWDERENAIVPRWRIVRSEPKGTPRVFSKLKVVAALMDAGVWTQVKQYIENKPGLYDLYLAAQEFAEDNRYFVQGKAALQAALGWSDEDVERILAASVRAGA